MKLIKISLRRLCLQRKDLSEISALWRSQLYIKRNLICYLTAIYRQVYTHVSEKRLNKKINDVLREWNARAGIIPSIEYSIKRKKTFSRGGESGDDEESRAFDAKDMKTKRQKESGPPPSFFTVS